MSLPKTKLIGEIIRLCDSKKFVSQLLTTFSKIIKKLGSREIGL